MPFSTSCLIILLLLVFANKHFTAPNFDLVNKEDLNKILQSKIFLHTDDQMRVAHIILEYKPISSSFQSPKNIIKAKDPRLHQINVAMLGFLTGPPPERSHQVELPNQRATEEEVISQTQLKRKKLPGYLRW